MQPESTLHKWVEINYLNNDVYYNTDQQNISLTVDGKSDSTITAGSAIAVNSDGNVYIAGLKNSHAENKAVFFLVVMADILAFVFNIMIL